MTQFSTLFFLVCTFYAIKLKINIKYMLNLGKFVLGIVVLFQGIGHIGICNLTIYVYGRLCFSPLDSLDDSIYDNNFL